MTEQTISFFVAGEPKAKGSTRSFVIKGKAVTTSSNRNLKQWELRIAHEAQACVPLGFCDGESAYKVEVRFQFPEPKSHAKAYIYWHTKRPDIDKLGRAVLDALTGVCWHDDAQVMELLLQKEYAAKHCSKEFGPGARIRILKTSGRFRR